MKDNHSAGAGALEQRFHQIHVQNELIPHKLQCIEEGLKSKKRKKTKQKVLPLYFHTLNWHSKHIQSSQPSEVIDLSTNTYKILPHKAEVSSEALDRYVSYPSK